MKTVRILLLVTLAWALVVPASWGAAERNQDRRKLSILYKIKPEATRQEQKRLEAVTKFLGTRAKKTIRNVDIQLDEYLSWSGSEEEAAEMLLATGAVLFAEPDYLVAPDATTSNDPSLKSQWQHSKINSFGAWDTVTGNSSILVAVCDTGISSNHPDLVANLQLPGFNTVDNSTNTEPIYNHGTGVAGCIGAVGNNATGVAGVVWDVRILPIRITNTTDGMAYISDAAEGIRYAADQGAKVVNLSYRMASYSTIDSAAQYLRGKGGLLFVAAGNDGIQQSWPDFPSFLAVGATTSTDTKASFSNTGAYIDLVAPGSSVYSTTSSSSYAYMSGTSFSSPIAGGLAALIYSLNPSFTPEQVESFLIQGCVDLGAAGEDSSFGAGRIDAAQSIALALGAGTNESPVAILEVSPSEGDAPMEVIADGGGSFDPDGSIVAYQWDFGDGTKATGMEANHTYTQEGTYTVTLTVTDDQNTKSSASTQVWVRPDQAKVISVRDITMSWAKVSGGVVARAAVSIADSYGVPVSGVSVTVKWTGTKSGTSVGTTGTNGVAVLSSPKVKSTFSFTATVTAVSLTGYTYDPTLNTETSDSIKN